MGGPYKKDCDILEYILKSPCSGHFRKDSSRRALGLGLGFKGKKKAEMSRLSRTVKNPMNSYWGFRL